MAYHDQRPLFGTVRFASIRSHLAAEPSHRDYMESLGYVLLYFLRRSLPWLGLLGETRRDEHNLVRDKKMTTPVEELCRGLPDEFQFCTNYTRSLRFDDKPDYSRLRRHFQDLFTRQQFQRDYCYDWLGSGTRNSVVDHRLPAQMNLMLLDVVLVGKNGFDKSITSYWEMLYG